MLVLAELIFNADMGNQISKYAALFKRVIHLYLCYVFNPINITCHSNSFSTHNCPNHRLLLYQMSIFVFSQGKFVFSIFTLITNCTRHFSQYTYVALTKNMATDYYSTRCLSSPNVCCRFLTCLRELTKDLRHVLSKRNPLNPRHTT